MPRISNEEHYYRNEYEQLRRRKNKEIETQRQRFHDFVIATYKLLKLLGMREKDIFNYYVHTTKI